MPGRIDNSNACRYGFQNQESDNEVYGTKNLYAFKYRMNDVRLNRFWSVDPLMYKYPYNSSYAFSENRVIDAVELEGLEKYSVKVAAAISQGTVALGITDVFNSSFTPFGGSELGLEFALSYDAKNYRFTIEGAGSFTQIKEGAYSFATGAGGETRTVKEGEASFAIGVDFASGELIGEGKVTSEDKFKVEESAVVGFITRTSKDNKMESSYGLKDLKAELLIVGAKASLVGTVEESPKINRPKVKVDIGFKNSSPQKFIMPDISVPNDNIPASPSSFK